LLPCYGEMKMIINPLIPSASSEGALHSMLCSLL